MNKQILAFLLVSSVLNITTSVFAERDWEYWSQESVAISINKTVSYLIIPEWRFKNNMQYNYLFKLETGPSVKINKILEIATYYVYQEKQSGGMWDRSDLAYFDTTLKEEFKDLFDLKVSNRLRYQYDFDKTKTILRDAIKISKGFKMGKSEITPYASEEPFYDAKLERVNEHRTAVGLGYNLSENISIGMGYMLNSKKSINKWTYANVLISNINIRF